MTDDKFRRWILPASLALNMFFLGFGASQWLHHPPGPPPGYLPGGPHAPHGPQQMLEDMASRLPSADAALLRAAMTAHPEAMAGGLLGDPSGGEDLLRVRLPELLSSEPFDVAAFKATLIEVRQSHRGLDDFLETVFPDVVAAMSPAGRRALAQAYFRPPFPPPPPPPR